MRYLDTLKLLVVLAFVLMSCKTVTGVTVETTATPIPSMPTEIPSLPTAAEAATVEATQPQQLQPSEEPTATFIPPTATQSGPFTLTSAAFQNRQPIAQLYTCQGKDISPPLSWSGVPAGAKSLALIVDDPDAPGGVFVHWILFNIPPEISELPEGIAKTEVVEGIGIHGKNSFGYRYYRGPCPPAGDYHRYIFKLYALDTILDLPAGSKKADVEAAMQGHILDQVELVGLYKRSG